MNMKKRIKRFHCDIDQISEIVIVMIVTSTSMYGVEAMASLPIF